MALLAFWPAPRNEDVDIFRVLRASASSGPFDEIASIPARDYYDAWVTHYLDEGVSSGTYYYRVQHISSDVPVGLSDVMTGVTPYAVTPQMVLDTIQGIPFNAVDAKLVQLRLDWAVNWAETRIRQKLSETTVTKEVHGFEAFKKMVGADRGGKIRLRHFPVLPWDSDTDKIYYRIRGAAAASQDTEWADLDVQIEHNGAEGYNRGHLSIYPRSGTIYSFLQLVRGFYHRNDISILFTYRHGWTTWPGDLVKLITELVAADVMEIAGEADTAGLSSRSVDGYSETYTASATTTVFSARRMWYEKRADEIFKFHRKPIWG